MKLADLKLVTDKRPRSGDSFDLFIDDFVSIEDKFTSFAERYSDRLALSDESGQLTFRDLDRFSAALARFIISLCKVHEAAVGVMCSRSRWFAASALGILRAGAVYVPVDPALPYSRKMEMLEACSASLLIVENATMGDAVQLQYDCVKLEHVICADREDFFSAIEPGGDRMSRELWEHVTAGQSDASWISMFSREPFSVEVIESLAENVLVKTSDKLKSSARILDIGSGSGAVARQLAGRCSKYVALDFTQTELERLEIDLRKMYPDLQVECHPFEALDIGLLPMESFDLVVMNSVAENFPGLNYFRAVIDKAVKLLAPEGVLFVGGLLDPLTRRELVTRLRDYASHTGEMRGILQYESGVDLWIPRELITDWAVDCSIPVNLEFSPSGIAEPELSDYRYDVRIKRVAAPDNSESKPKRKHSYGIADVYEISDNNDSVTELSEITADKAAYIIFTSGSTGTPKGVLVEHGSLMNLAESLHETLYKPVFNDAPQDIALVASFSFDASLQQLILAFMRGHTLHILPEESKRESGAVSGFLRKQRIAVTDMTPSLFSLFVDELIERGNHTDTRVFIVGGEKLTGELLKRFYSIPEHADVRIVNAYGPTECCVDSTLYVFTVTNYNEHETPPIGIPVSRTVIEVRDRNGEPLPDGVPGEFWIGGAGVARGYINDPEGTSKRFIKDAVNPEIRWYRSGDYGRKLRNGLFHFSGREDHQVKIGGFRIELGEVENALKSCPLISDGVVIAADISGNGTQILIAYVITESEPDVQGIKYYLQSVLPAHAVPSRFIRIDRIPMTSSSKVDRKKLPSPIDSIPQSSPDSRTPEGKTETILAGLWTKLLGMQIQDARADFFTLGGHSVLAVRLMSLVEKEFGVRLPLSQLFTTPTIEGLARHIVNRTDESKLWNPLVSVRKEGSKAPIFFFHPVGGNVLCYQGLAQELPNDRSVYMLEAPGFMDGQPELTSVEEMVDFYLKHILQEIHEGNYILAGWSFGGLLAFEAARQLSAKGYNIESLILLDSVASKDKVRDLMQQDEAGFLSVMFGDVIDLTAEALRKLDPGMRLDELVRRGQDRRIFPGDFDRNKMRTLLKVYMTNGLASSRYSLRKYPGNALLIRPRTVSKTALNVEGDDLQGWGQFIESGVKLEWIDGTHETLLQPPNLEPLGRIITEYLASQVI